MLLLIAGLIESLLLYPMFHVFAIAIAIAIAVVFVVNATSEHARGMSWLVLTLFLDP